MPDSESLRLQTELVPAGPAGAVILSPEQVAALGGGKRPPVVVTVGGKSARLRVAPMGGRFLIGFSKAVRAVLDVEIGDVIDVEISLDASERTVEVPTDLAAALTAEPAAAEAYERMSYTHRKEFVQWVLEAKREATRARRIAATVDMLKAGRTR